MTEQRPDPYPIPKTDDEKRTAPTTTDSNHNTK